MILPSQMFDLEIRDKKGSENLVSKHVSHCKSKKSDPIDEINEIFPNEMIFQIGTMP